MKHFNFRHILTSAAVFIVLSVLGLWSWNTLAPLFDGPQAQYKHVLAAAVALLILRWSLPGGFPLRPLRHNCKIHPGRSCDQNSSRPGDSGSEPAVSPAPVQP